MIYVLFINILIFILATNEPNKELHEHGVSCIPANSHGDKPCCEATIPLHVQDSHFPSDSKTTVNKILDNLKSYILSRNDANDNFVPNKDFNIPAAKVVFSWLQKQFKNLAVDIEVSVKKYFISHCKDVVC